jgi:hypothetical protein
MTFKKPLGPPQPFWREMEPVNLFQAAMTKPPSQPEGTNATQETGHGSGHQGLPQRIRSFPQNKSGPQKNRFTRQGNAEIVQKNDDKDEHISVMRNVGQ